MLDTKIPSLLLKLMVISIQNKIFNYHQLFKDFSKKNLHYYQKSLFKNQLNMNLHLLMPMAYYISDQ